VDLNISLYWKKQGLRNRRSGNHHE